MPGLLLRVSYTLSRSKTENPVREILIISQCECQETDLDSNTPGRERGDSQGGGVEERSILFGGGRLEGSEERSRSEKGREGQKDRGNSSGKGQGTEGVGKCRN